MLETLNMTFIEVAIAVIHYEHNYLLGFRHKAQHQGNRYEFIGGKIEPDESPIQALQRELNEEIGLQLNRCKTSNRLGVITHTYQDKKANSERSAKQIRLHIFRVTLSGPQYHQYQSLSIGREGQGLHWVDLQDLLSEKYRLPDANKTILEWLKLPDIIVITFDIFSIPNEYTFENEPPTADHNYKKENLNNGTDSRSSDTYQAYTHKLSTHKLSIVKTDLDAERHSGRVSNKDIIDIPKHYRRWLEFHVNRLPKGSCVYVRLKEAGTELAVEAVLALLQQRADLSLIINIAVIDQIKLTSKFEDKSLFKQVVAQHLSQKQLMTLSQNENTNKNNTNTNITDNKNKMNNLSGYEELLSTLPIVVSCHDIASIKEANRVAADRVALNLSPIIGMFISPVAVTQSHPNKTPLGHRKFSELVQYSNIPVIGLGGLKTNELNSIRRLGGDKIAGIRHFI